MTEDTQSEELPAAKAAAASVVGGLTDLTDGGVLLPRFMRRGEDGLYLDASLLESAKSFVQFADRVFGADALFSDLNYPLFLKLLYDADDPALPEKTAGQELRLSRDIISFPPERRAIYHDVRISTDASSAEYLFEPVSIDEEIEEPLFGSPEEDGGTPIIGYEKRTRPVPTKLDPDEFVAAMWAKGVRYGIDMEAVRAAIATDGGERLEIARWREPLAGTDAGILEQTDLLHRDDAPMVLANGRIDLCQFRNHFPQVSADTRLLKKSPRVVGEQGWNVRGAAIEPAMPKDFDIETLAGPGTKIERSAAGEFIVAAITGFIHIDTKSNQISISDKIINLLGISLRTTGDLSLAGADFEEHGEVQEQRLVKGHNMTFLADVFGEVVSDGGVITLKANLAGGSAHSPNGNIVIEGTASRATIGARGGEVVIHAAESCLVSASRVRIVRAVNCEILAEEVTVETCEGCAVAGKAVHIGDAGSRRDAETVVTVLLPDHSALNKDIEALVGKIGEAAKARTERERAAALISDKPEVKKFLALRQRVEAKEISMSTEQEIGWRSAQARFAAVIRQLGLLGGEIGEFAERERHYSEQIKALEDEKAQASTKLSCTLDAVTGDTVVRTMKVAVAGFPLADLPIKEIHKQLRSHGTLQDRLFSGSSGSFNWPEKSTDEGTPDV